MTIEELLERREAAGREEGRTAGRGEMLQEQIQKKLEKGKDISTIAKELEADVNTIERLVVQIEKDS